MENKLLSIFDTLEQLHENEYLLSKFYKRDSIDIAPYNLMFCQVQVNNIYNRCFEYNEILKTELSSLSNMLYTIYMSSMINQIDLFFNIIYDDSDFLKIPEIKRITEFVDTCQKI